MEVEKTTLLEIRDGIAILTINRPDVRNAVNTACWNEISAFIDEVSTNTEIRVAIITGAGNEIFAAGADLKMLHARTAVSALESIGQGILRRLELCSKPVIAAVNGLAFGAGCEIAIACDFRIVSENAKFALPEVSLGVLPGAGGTQRLSKLIGLGRAKDVILIGRTIEAKEAVQIGLATKCVPQGESLNTALEFAAKIMSKGPLAVALAKKAINISLSADQDTGLLAELLGFSILCDSHDKKEGIEAFFEKRPPNYKGF